METLILLFLLIFVVVSIFALMLVIKGISDDSKEVVLVILVVYGILTGLVLLWLISPLLDSKYHSVKPLINHIDESKTKIVEENEECKELYITVDSKEYHFVFEVND